MTHKHRAQMSWMKTGTIHFGSLHGKFGAWFLEWGKPPNTEQSRARARVRKRDEKCAAKLGNCIKWLYFDTLWLGFRFFMFIYIHPSLHFLCFALHCSALSFCLRPCFVTMLIHWIYHHKWNTPNTHFFRHNQHSSLLACTRKILALIYTIHFENWIYSIHTVHTHTHRISKAAS